MQRVSKTCRAYLQLLINTILPELHLVGLLYIIVVKNCFLRMVVFLLFPWRLEQYIQPQWICNSTKQHNMTSLKNGFHEIWYWQSTQWTMSHKFILAHNGSSQVQYWVKIKLTSIKYRVFHNVLHDHKHLQQENQRTYLNGIVHSHGKTEKVIFDN